MRIVRVLPDLRVLLLGVWRSVPPLASIGAVTAMILFVYGMVGWIWFGDELPDQWGNIGRAMLTLFVMLTLEDFPVYMDEAMEVEPWAWIYFVSFILVAAFIVLNVLIGVVLNSMEEAREIDRRGALRQRYGVTRPSPVDPQAHAPVAERIAILRSALDELELELALGPGTDEDARRPSARHPPASPAVEDVGRHGLPLSLYPQRRERLDDRPRPERVERRLADEDSAHRRGGL